MQPARQYIPIIQ